MLALVSPENGTILNLCVQCTASVPFSVTDHLILHSSNSMSSEFGRAVAVIASFTSSCTWSRPLL